MSARTAVTCTRCSTTADVPQDGGFRALWDAGWPWIGSYDLFSCPLCPPVIRVAEDGSHHLGPGAPSVG